MGPFGELFFAQCRNSRTVPKKDKTRDPLTRQGFAKIFIPRHTWNKTVCSSYLIGCMNKLAT